MISQDFREVVSLDFGQTLRPQAETRDMTRHDGKARHYLDTRKTNPIVVSYMSR